MAKEAAPEVPTTLRLGTRTSKLALWQTNHVAARLQQQWPHLQCELVHLVTQGDKRLDRPLPEIGGKGLFTAELEEALRRGEIDLAVHSLKDLPVEDPDDLIIGAILSREDTRDVLVAREPWTVATLPKGAIVGTSSLRRQAQLLAARPDLKVQSIRGNVDTRIRKVLNGDYDAAVMAGAGLLRLGLTEHITEWLDKELMLPAPGQGALAVQCRAHDPAVHALLAAIHDPQAAATTLAERQLLYRLGGGCSAPIGAWAQIVDERVVLRARVAALDGRHTYEAMAVGSDPYAVAQEVADALVAQGAERALSRSVRVNGQPLAGKRIVITRPGEDDGAAGGEFAELLRARGAVPVLVPAIQLVPSADAKQLHQAVNDLADYDWIIFTSANAVEFFWQMASEQLISLKSMHGQLPKIAAVGPKTAAALSAKGLSVDAMPERFLGKEIAGVLGDLQGKRILLPRSAQGSSELPALLRERGAMVKDVPLYTPVAAPISEAQRVALLEGVDVVTFASGSAVRGLVTALHEDERFGDFWSKVVVACIGPATAEVARAEGIAVHVVAQEHTASGMVSALSNYFEQGA